MRLLLIDTDVFVILAGAGLIDRVAELLGFEPSQVRRLYPVENQLTRGRSFRARYPATVIQSALAKTKLVTPLTDRPANDAVFQKLAAVSDIDEGEALMFSLLAENPSWLLTTGDRRSLVALATNPELKEVSGVLAGRLVCIESVLRLLVVKDGVAKIAAAFAPVRETNQKLRVIFSEANATNLDSCLEGIDSYLAALRREVGDHLLYEQH